MKTLNTTSAMLMAISVAGCTPSFGTKFNDAYVPQIKRGATTKAEIRKSIGEPPTISYTSEGEVWTYQYTDGGSYGNMVGAGYGLTSFKINMQMLTIQFSGDIVKDFNYTVQKAQ